MKPADASEQTIFDAAQQLSDAPARAAYLDAACAGNPSLRERIEKLLQAGQRADEFLAADPLELRAATAQTVAPLSEGPGTVIGNYKLLEKLGEGGFGVVYMAEQKRPVKRRVALKIIKVGMDTREVVARFEAERQALALMEHPNIAKVFDAGSTDTGRPYFVMELVRGIKITDYCDEKSLSTKDRLGLFVQVCQAVQHAHQKGIIHRDLKPSNILVTVNDGQAVSKVIDFGIAKATQMELTEKTVFTRFHQFIGTPAYISPEQAELSSVDIDTRSDIYSLGVLLYELLTGKTPFDPKELLQAGLDEMRRTIREKEPARPSTRVSTLGADELTTTAKRRGLDAPKLVNVLRGDLDWIVMKCIEKDRARRYETANGLARDIQRHLTNEPVVACPPSSVYWLQKFVRRNKGPFAAGASVVAALILGLGVATWMYLQERAARKEQVRLRHEAELARNSETKQRQIAEQNELRALDSERTALTEARKSRLGGRFFRDILRGAGPSRAAGRDTTILRELLDKTTKNIATELTNLPEVEIEIRGDLAMTYDELGLYQQEEEIARKSLELARSHFPSNSAPAALALHQVAFALISLGRDKEAEEAAAESVAIQRKLLCDEINRPSSILDVMGTDDRYREQRELIRASLKTRIRDQQYVLGSSLYDLAHIYFNLRKFHDAENAFRESLALLKELHPEDNRDVATQLNGLGLTLIQEGDPVEAEACLREALDTYRRLYEGNPNPDIAITLANVAVSLKAQGKFNDAEGLAREGLDMARRMFGPEHREVAMGIMNLADGVQLQGRLLEAEMLRRDALTMARNLKNSALIMNALDGLSGTLREEGKLEEARQVISEGLALRRRLFPTEDLRVADSLASLAYVLDRLGQAAQAEPFARECLAIREKKIPDDWRTFNARSLLGESLLGQKKYIEAEPLLISGAKGIKQRLDKAGGGKARLTESMRRLIQLYEETKRPDQAAEWKRRMAEFLESD